MTAKTSSAEQKHQGWMQSSTVRAVQEAGGDAGHEYGLAESTARMLARLLGRQARQKFGGADEAGLATLDGLALAFASEQLFGLAERIIGASSWGEWLAGVTAPPPASDLPEYTKDLEIDLELSSPSIDTHMKVGLTGGGETVVHIRIQKWYQPNLDRHLFEASRKLERKYGEMPKVVVILMWPPADGPGVTGQFAERDGRGKVKRTFRYAIQRAWELEPEPMMKSPGTMLLAPMAKGAKERMPEIVQMLKKGLDDCKPDEKTRQAVWDAVYWSMGLVCDLEEAHRALGDVLPAIQNSANYVSAKGHAFLNAYYAVQREAQVEATRALVQRQAICRFGNLPGLAETLAAIASMNALEGLARRVLTAADWPSLIGKPGAS